MVQVVTASRLNDGVVVFLGPDSTWVEALANAVTFPAKEATAAGLAAGGAAEANNLVVDVYAVDVAERNGVRVPTKLREAIRARGPTVHPEFCKPVADPHPPVPEDDHVSV